MSTKIKRDRPNVFSLSIKENFYEQSIDRLSNTFQSIIKANEIKLNDLDKMVRNGVQRAEKYGIVNQDDMELFLDCLLILGVNFDADPARPELNEILNKDGLIGLEKMEQIQAYLLFSDMV